MTAETNDSLSVNGRRWRILVVENNALILADHVRNLDHWGFDVYPARGQGLGLLQNARELARQMRCHMAIVDMRLLDDDDPSDISGFELVEQLAPLPAFIVSSYGSLQKASQAISKSGAKEFIGKEEGPRRLRAAIEHYLQDYCSNSQYSGEIRWAAGWKPERIVVELFEDQTPAQAAEIVCVVRRLFHEKPFDQTRALRFSTISGAARATHTHSSRHSTVFKVSADALQPAFVKFASVDQVEAEHANYLQHIWQQLPAARHSQLQRCEAVGYVGGIRYGFLGTDSDGLRTLGDCMDDLSADEINHCLSIFFQETWAAKYRSQTLSPKSLFGAYADVWSAKWIERMLEFPIQEPKILFQIADDVTVELPNPLVWLLSRVDYEHDYADDVTASIVHYTAVTHGDLHCHNIFIDKHGEPWIIDYERTGEGPVLRDFVELEVDLIAQHLSSHTVDSQDLFRFFISLLTSDSVNLRVRLDACADELAKLGDILYNLRSLAHFVAMPKDARELYWGLLLDISLTLIHVIGKTHSPADNPFLRSAVVNAQTAAVDELKEKNNSLWGLLLLGAMISYRLDYWDKPWPPKTWNAGA